MLILSRIKKETGGINLKCLLDLTYQLSFQSVINIYKIRRQIFYILCFILRLPGPMCIIF